MKKGAMASVCFFVFCIVSCSSADSYPIFRMGIGTHLMTLPKSEMDAYFNQSPPNIGSGARVYEYKFKDNKKVALISYSDLKRPPISVIIGGAEESAENDTLPTEP